ncbi:type II toxin-antitoxin system HicB family antitoxin [Youngiibacter fragilis]|uniref:Pilus biosynthesis protein HicB n=1 Tax=Youngiibacter fragilis 232.1 TaxID=994573 RepID=V7I9I6_9CLOT|nr:type II toxin-antitoxin system HicB family antitoxin [Youngiibacter fragilis]ETA82508.1 pilus biosynthesis protein HicB [Youngiibacter fragilis 232.1]
MKDRYVFPALFEYEGNDINVSFPDLPGCLTFGNNEAEAMFNAKEALEGYLYVLESDNDEIPEPSKIKDIERLDNEVVVLVDVWMPLVRDQESNKAVKKTLTIPKWLNDVAEQNNVNFSHLLQAALKKHLGVNR